MPRNDSQYPQYSNEFRRIRKQAGLTQLQLAELLGLKAKNNISAIENGTAKPSLDMLTKMGDKLGYDIEVRFKKKK